MPLPARPTEVPELSYLRKLVAERLSEEGVQTIVREFAACTSKRGLAGRFSISESSIRRIVHEHGVRRRSWKDKIV